MKTTNAIAPRIFSRLVETYLQVEKVADATPWGSSPKEEAHEAAKQRFETARATLRDAVANAPWGQNSSVFITERSIRLGVSDRVRILYINSLPRVKVTLSYDSRKPWLEEVYTVEKGRQMREDLKRYRRATQDEYMAERARLLIDLEAFGHVETSDFGAWRYYDGQDGGTFYREGRPCVAAWPALRAVWGDDWQNHIPVTVATLELEREWDQRVHGAKY